MDGKTEGWTNGRRDGGTEGQRDGDTEGRRKGVTEGWIEAHLHELNSDLKLKHFVTV